MSGIFITFEGGEGSGKSTQCQALAERLGQAGQSVTLTREPGGSQGAEEIRKLLVEGDPDKWSSMAETLLFYAARDDHLTKTIRPALNSGKWVICDRFADSTRAYQGAQQNNLENLLEILEQTVIGKTQPDLTFLLDIDPKTGLERASNRGGIGGSEDRFERKKLAFHTQLREAFLEIAKSAANRFIVLDANKSSSALEIEIWQIVTERFGSKLNNT